MSSEKEQPIRGFDEAESNFYTTTFLDLLIKYNYVWSSNDRDKIKLSLWRKQKVQFLHDFNLVFPEYVDEFQASVMLSSIKEFYDEASKKEGTSELPWFSTAHKLFREYTREGREISVQDFKRNELLNLYNHLIDEDLLVISNRNLHLQTIHKEFIEFSKFISYPEHKKDFGVFLIPVFKHLYWLIRSHKGKSDAKRFISNLKYMYLPSDVIDELEKCNTCEELDSLLMSQARIRVKLTKESYDILMNWLRERFSRYSEMFILLRVLHENFHVDLYEDKDKEEDFSVLDKKIKKWKKNFKIQKKLGFKVTAEGCKTQQSDVDDVAQNMSKLEIVTETVATSESIGSASNFELPKFKIRDSGRRHLEYVINSDWDFEKKCQALRNPPDPKVGNSSAKDDLMMDISEDPRQNQNAAKDDPKMDFLEGAGQIENAGSSSLRHPAPFSPEVTTDGVKKKEEQEKIKYQFKESYKSNFHSANPLTISGKDVLCSSDVSSDMLYLACAFESCKICTWHLSGENGFELKPIGTLRGHKGIVYALSIDSKKSKLISGSHDCTVRIWDLLESELLSTILVHKAPVYTVCASPNSKYYLTASEDKRILLFFYDEVYPFRTYAGHSMEAINCVKFHPNCSYFASASSDGNLFLFKINYESCPVRMFSRHIAKVFTLAFSPCGKYLASGDVEGILIIWDILTYTPQKIIETKQGIRSLSYDNSGSFIAALFYYQSWKVYSIEEDNEYVVIEAESVAVPKSVHFSDSNKMLIIQYLEADKSKIAVTKGKPKTAIKMVG